MECKKQQGTNLLLKSLTMLPVHFSNRQTSHPQHVVEVCIVSPSKLPSRTIQLNFLDLTPLLAGQRHLSVSVQTVEYKL